ncbi:IucA/IucC family protein [Streptosporangium subroseum]|uniref:IucA/IucC family protein n=1 Tax=Streptosporangium subroseum TaxID=106412 RepID=UPI001FE81419|nr:IucA/IucC family protein [Streptosporangium subroseum]
MSGREPYLAARVLNALLREDYGGLTARVTRSKDGVALVLPRGRRVRLTPGSLFQDFVVAPEEALRLEEVLHTLREVSAPTDAPGVEAFVQECLEALRSLDLHDAHREEVLARLGAEPSRTPERLGAVRSRASGAVPSQGSGAVPSQASSAVPSQSSSPVPSQGSGAVRSPASGAVPSQGSGAVPSQTSGAVPIQASGALRPVSGMGHGTVRYETLAAFVDHPVYPTARCRIGLSDKELTAYAPEFAPAFELRWAAVPRERQAGAEMPEAPGFATVGLDERLAETHVLFPVHPLTVPAVEEIPWAIMGPEPYLEVRPTLSMRTVEIVPGTHLKLPLTTSTLGLRNRRSIKPDTLADGARAELLLREMPDPGVIIADEQTYGHAGHEYLGWLLRRHPAGEAVPVAALLAPLPGGGVVVEELAGRWYGGDVTRLLGWYLRLLFGFHVRLFVRYGTALEAHQQNLSLLFGNGPAKLLVKDNDGLLTSPDRLRSAGVAVPDFADGRMLTDDPHALADVFVTITLHLAAAAVTFGALPSPQAARLICDALADALDEYGEDPMARLLRARTLDAARLVGKSMITAGTLVDKARTGARDVNKFYGTSGPNYLRQPPQAVQTVTMQRTT